MPNALSYLITTLLDMYVLAVLLRLLISFGRPDSRNPLILTLGKLTNPLVLPTRRFVPPIGTLDTATLVVLLMLQILASAILVNSACMGATLGQIMLFGLVRLIDLVLMLYFWLLIAYVVASWIKPGESLRPAMSLLTAIIEPVLAPLRRVLPAVGGLDLSPILAFIAIGFLQRLFPPAQQVAGLVCLAL